MPRKDLYHDTVKHALEKDGWLITHDPLSIPIGEKFIFVDLGAEKLILGEKAGKKIAVEVKSFIGKSDIADLEDAVGQYIVYRTILAHYMPERKLYLAVSQTTLESVFDTDMGELLLKAENIQLLVFDRHKEVIVKWLP